MSSGNYEHAMQRASVWLADVCAALGTHDRHYAHRVLRTWLHTLRDRLTVEAAAKFGQQLPELLRGTYYDGWEPSQVPIKYSPAEYVHRFSTEAFIPASEVPNIAASVTQAIAEHMSPGQVAETLTELPSGLRATIRDGAPVTDGGGRTRSRAAAPSLDEKLATLTEAVLSLARGLESEPPASQRTDPAYVSRAARLAEEILVAGRQGM
jgi:uncharacterized protein (DUF2267 family)